MRRHENGVHNGIVEKARVTVFFRERAGKLLEHIAEAFVRLGNTGRGTVFERTGREIAETGVRVECTQDKRFFDALILTDRFCAVFIKFCGYFRLKLKRFFFDFHKRCVFFFGDG